LEIHDVQSTEGAVNMIVQSVHLEGTTDSAECSFGRYDW